MALISKKIGLAFDLIWKVGAADLLIGGTNAAILKKVNGKEICWILSKGYSSH